jgi:hypothetical protein
MLAQLAGYIGGRGAGRGSYRPVRRSVVKRVVLVGLPGLVLRERREAAPSGYRLSMDGSSGPESGNEELTDIQLLTGARAHLAGVCDFRVCIQSDDERHAWQRP